MLSKINYVKLHWLTQEKKQAYRKDSNQLHMRWKENKNSYFEKLNIKSRFRTGFQRFRRFPSKI